MELDRCDETSEKKKLESVGEGENLVAVRERKKDNDSGAALDFQGIEDDDVDWEADETMASRLRRRRDSSFILKRRPVALGDRNSISPNLAKSAFVPIEMPAPSDSLEGSPPRAGLQACAMFASPLEESSQGSHYEDSEVASCSHDSPKAMGSFTGSLIPSNTDQDDESATNHCVVVLQTVLKVNDRSILETIPEGHGGLIYGTPASTFDDLNTLRLENRTLHEEVKALRIANVNHENKLYAMQKAYEARITPFRDLFDDVSYDDIIFVLRKVSLEFTKRFLLCVQVNLLRLENQVLKQEKSQTKKMVEDVKEQMIQCLQSAVNKNQELQKQLNAGTAEKQKLEQELEECRKQLDVWHAKK
jgi:hypothetical protein